MEQEIADLGKEISRLERQEAMEAELNKPVNMPITSKPFSGKDPEKKTGRASDEYRNAMLDAFRSNFKRVSNVLQEGVDADGGYLVPVEYDHRLIDVLTEENIMRKLATEITTSGEHKINIAATKPAAAWIEEGGALQFSDATFSQILLDAHKLHVAIKVTEELLYDNAFNLENYILAQFGKALVNSEEDAFLNGDGVGKPLGLIAATGGGTVASTLDVDFSQSREIIEKLSDGLDTIIGSKGTYLSGGEQQRIAIARAIVKNAPIVLLDEATAFADPENEHLIQKALKELGRGKTTLMIAHRLTTVQNVDRILVIQEGKIAEEGSHMELLKQGGAYKAMWEEYQKSVDWKIKDNNVAIGGQHA